jgi:hypothetical protein
MIVADGLASEACIFGLVFAGIVRGAVVALELIFWDDKFDGEVQNGGVVVLDEMVGDAPCA